VFDKSAHGCKLAPPYDAVCVGWEKDPCSEDKTLGEKMLRKRERRHRRRLLVGEMVAWCVAQKVKDSCPMVIFVSQISARNHLSSGTDGSVSNGIRDCNKCPIRIFYRFHLSNTNFHIQ